MRSFHANEDGEESRCASPGFSQKEVDVYKFYVLLIHTTIRGWLSFNAI